MHGGCNAIQVGRPIDLKRAIRRWRWQWRWQWHPRDPFDGINIDIVTNGLVGAEAAGRRGRPGVRVRATGPPGRTGRTWDTSATGPWAAPELARRQHKHAIWSDRTTRGDPQVVDRSVRFLNFGDHCCAIQLEASDRWAGEKPHRVHPQENENTPRGSASSGFPPSARRPVRQHQPMPLRERRRARPTVQGLNVSHRGSLWTYRPSRQVGPRPLGECEKRGRRPMRPNERVRK